MKLFYVNTKKIRKFVKKKSYQSILISIIPSHKSCYPAGEAENNIYFDL